jgi:filamentous hemagglutinin family protein
MDESTVRSRPPDSIRQAFLWVLLPTLVLFLIAPSVGDAQVPVVTNITSSGLGTDVQPPSGGVYNITGGTRPGVNGLNLFHSFGDFSVRSGDIANFLNDSGLTTANILGRVTGGNISNIYGTIQTTGFDVEGVPTNLFLVNPSGIVFGPQGSFDVGGSVSMSTADYLRFEGTSTLFDMLSSPASLGSLSVAPVVAFGFTGPELPAPITVQGSLLQVPEGKALSLVGGDITLQAEPFEDGTMQAANLLAPSGQVNLVAVASPGEVLVPSFQTGPNINGTSFTTMGTVTLKEGAMLDVSGQLGADADGNTIGGNSGTVLVRGGQLVMDASTIVAITRGAVDGARTAVDIRVSDNVTLTNGAVIATQTSGAGRGGDVHMTADRLTLENSSGIVTKNSEFGEVGGDLFLNVGTLNLLGGALIGSINSTGVDLDEDGVVDVTGVGGNITVQGTTPGANNAADSVELSGSSRITSDAGSTSGNGGGISIRATSLDLNEGSSISSSTAGTGLGGNIVLSVRQLGVVDGATISSSTSSENPTPAASGMVTVQGLAGPGSMASSVRLSGPNSGIVSDSSSGVPGDITVNAGTLTVTNGAVISAGSSQSAGPAGDVTVTADSVVISADGQIFSRSFAQNSGQVTITADALTMDNGSIVTSTSSESGGRGGDVVLNGGTVRLTNGASINSQSGSEEDQGRFSTGRAGDIIMSVTSLTLAKRSKITSSSLGTEPNAGDAGNITIQSESTVVLNDSLITTEARAASGGKIEINAPEMIRLTNSEVSTSVKGVAGESNGGDISIDPQFVILQNSQMIAQANAGAGGAIDIIATSAFIRDPASIVDASSTLGISGTINIQSPLQNVGGELAALSDEFSSAAALLAQQCAARAAGGTFSTFVVAAREGVPVEPGGFLASPSLTAESLGSRLPGRDSHPQLSTVTGAFPEYEARPIQLARLGNACHR